MEEDEERAEVPHELVEPDDRVLPEGRRHRSDAGDEDVLQTPHGQADEPERDGELSPEASAGGERPQGGEDQGEDDDRQVEQAPEGAAVGQPHRTGPSDPAGYRSSGTRSRDQASIT